ncbi:MAG: hypothetical protein Q9190_006569 [Brigantiaea leucoxantha]
MEAADLKKRQLKDYPFRQDYRTRWSDNDMYQHLNNSIYSFLFDSVINAFLITHCALSPSQAPQIGLVVHSHCDFFGSIAFPSIVDLGLRVNKLGKSSVTYEVGVFEQGSNDVRAVGNFVHVFVERENNRPAAQGMPEAMREGLKSIMTERSRL